MGDYLRGPLHEWDALQQLTTCAADTCAWMAWTAAVLTSVVGHVSIWAKDSTRICVKTWHYTYVYFSYYIEGAGCLLHSSGLIFIQDLAAKFVPTYGGEWVDLAHELALVTRLVQSEALAKVHLTLRAQEESYWVHWKQIKCYSWCSGNWWSSRCLSGWP